MGFGRQQVSWLPVLPCRAFPSRISRSSGLRILRVATGLSGNSGGSAPDFHRLPLTTDPSPPILPDGARVKPEIGAR
jgi:hypothetical protein